jgi:hypothetical protein
MRRLTILTLVAMLALLGLATLAAAQSGQTMTCQTHPSGQTICQGSSSTMTCQTHPSGQTICHSSDSPRAGIYPGEYLGLGPLGYPLGRALGGQQREEEALRQLQSQHPHGRTCTPVGESFFCY